MSRGVVSLVPMSSWRHVLKILNAYATGGTNLEIQYMTSVLSVIRLHYWWDKLRDTVHDICTKCHTCQMTKKTYQKYGHLPVKVTEADPWDVL